MRFIKHGFQLFKLLILVIRYQLYDTPNTKTRYNGRISKLFFIFYPLKWLPRKQDTYGARLALMLQNLGPIYIKLGQVLSTRPDIVGDDIAESLQLLQDKLPPFDSQIAISIVEQSLNGKIEQLFSDFAQEPIAAASISQVHKAITKNGQKVAVKILRPNIYDIYKQDVEFLYFLGRLAERFSKRCKRLKLRKVVETLDESMKIELDLRFEAAACSELKDKSIKDTSIYIPKVYWHLTSNYILTTEWLEGISIYDTEKLKANNLNLHDIASKIAVMFFNQAFRDGYFHADLHPGNVIILPSGKVSLIDFGIMGRLPEQDRLAMAEIIYGFLRRDYYQVAKIHVKAGYVPKDTNIDLFAQACRSIGEPIVGLPVGEISVGNLVGQLFKITDDFSMETQPQLILLQKTMMVVEGIGKKLDPKINMWVLAEEWIKKWAIKNLTPEAKILRFIRHNLDKLIDQIYEN
ncbi:MAG: ubiB [Rickettsiaceae bacterium]|jgi:ubiquinone biosynthesis protein|nr:ubiB [Rickettsiaceae bacterium]